MMKKFIKTIPALLIVFGCYGCEKQEEKTNQKVEQKKDFFDDNSKNKEDFNKDFLLE